jgi:hypothetical protein
VSVLLLWLGTAWSHPFSSDRLGHRTVISLDREAVVVEYRIEVPIRQILEELESAGESPEVYTEARVAELADGWLLKHDGALARLTRVPEREDRPSGNSRFFSFHLVLQAPLAPGDEPQRLKLINENFPGPVAFHYVEIQVTPGVQVLASSLFDLEGGEVRNLREARWRMEEESRVTEVLVQRDPPGLLDRLLGPLAGMDGTPRYAHRSLPTTWHRAWLAGTVGSGAVALGLLGALALGWVGSTGRGLKAAVGQGVGLLALTLPALLLIARFVPELALPWVPLGSAGVVLLAGLWLLRGKGPSAAPGLAVLAAGVGLQHDLLTLALVGCCVVAGLAGARQGKDRRRLVGAGLIVGACVLALRGLGVAELL